VNYTLRLYEKDERGQYWPAGQYTFDTRSKAVTSLSKMTGAGISGIITTRDFVTAYAEMTFIEAQRVSPVKNMQLGY
jgi:hypothetical protein